MEPFQIKVTLPSALPSPMCSPLVQTLLRSLDPGLEEGVEEDWDAEVARRLKRVHQGVAQGRPAEEVFGDIRAQHPK